MNDKQLKIFVEKIFQLAVTPEKTLDRERVHASLIALTEQFPASPHKVLNLYLQAAKKFFFQNDLTIEYVADVPTETLKRIQQHFESLFQQPFLLHTTLAPELIAGLKITLQDHVFEYSIALTLKQLNARFTP